MTHDLVWLRWIHDAVDRVQQAMSRGNPRAIRSAEAALREVIQAMWESEAA
jgi:hypothetical protein